MPTGSPSGLARKHVLNTPSSHRVHHARNPQYLDANFGGVLIVFDRLFGTYVEERKDVPCDFGLVAPEISFTQSSRAQRHAVGRPAEGPPLGAPRSARVDVSFWPAGLAAGRRRPDQRRTAPPRRACRRRRIGAAGNDPARWPGGAPLSNEGEEPARWS